MSSIFASAGRSIERSPTIVPMSRRAITLARFAGVACPTDLFHLLIDSRYCSPSVPVTWFAEKHGARSPAHLRKCILAVDPHR